MRILILPAAVLLASCADEPLEKDVIDTEGGEVVQNEMLGDESMSVAGLTFEVEGEPGVTRTAFDLEGGFTDYDGEAVYRTGRYEERADGQLCFTYPGDDAMPTEETECWTMEGPPDADGWATSRRVSDGLTIRARPIVED